MTKQPNTTHLVERAAQRLLDTDDLVAMQLLRRQSWAAAEIAAGQGAASAHPGEQTAALRAPASTGIVEPSKPPPDGLAVAPGNDPGIPLGPADLPGTAGRVGHSSVSGAIKTRRPPARVDSATLRDAGMIDWSLDRERLSEEFRIVQGQILRAMAAGVIKPPALPNLLMVTSARPGEGKTFSSLNIAGSLASCSGRKVILVDVDVKRHTLTTRLGLRPMPGILDLALDIRISDGEVLVETSLPNLRILPIGRVPADDALLGGKSIVAALERLARAHRDDLVVLDTPPCLSSSDPSTLAPITGAVVMLIEAQQTQRNEVEAALDLVEACPVTTLLLNKVQLTGSDTFGAYGY